MALAFWACMSPALAQETRFSTDVRVVNLLAIVRNPQGRIVSTLDREDFILEEEGRPQTIRYFSRETDLPLTLGLMVDTSYSMERMLREEKGASTRFFEKVLREDRDHAFVINFDYDVTLQQEMTSSRRELDRAIHRLKMPALGGVYGPHRRYHGIVRGGGTTLYDAVMLACDELMKKQSGRKALILISDGLENGSRTTLAEAVEAAERADTLVYTILISESVLPISGTTTLRSLSSLTGGSFFAVSEQQPLEQIFSRIEEELRSQYSLGYSPDRTGSGRRRIRLATKHNELIVQTRDGYYAQ